MSQGINPLGLFKFYETDAIANLEFQVDNPNDRNYTSTNLGIWSSVSDVEAFLSKFNHNTVYRDGNDKLRVGNYITIQDGTYNAVWEIAGFDMESYSGAADGTTYDNGYGICLVPQTYLTSSIWNSNNSCAYMNSYMNKTVLPGIVTNLQNVLGSHIVQRNVLLSSSIDANTTNRYQWYSNGYTWTTSYATLMSMVQMTGTFATNRNKYDDGEANYKLPLFNSKDFKTGSNFWTRGIYGSDNGGYISGIYYAYIVDSNGSISFDRFDSTNNVRPLIYIR